nr:ankyrin repeat domain-containing protein [uncultured Holophaga sp.]
MIPRSFAPAALLLLLGAPLSAQFGDIDFAYLGRRAVLERLEHPAPERPVDCYVFKPSGRTVTLSILGTRWAFLSEFDSAGHRLWRSFPLPIAGCTPFLDRSFKPFFQPFGEGGLVLCFPQAPPSAPSHWLLLPDHRILSVSEAGERTLRLWDGELDPEARVEEEVQRRWAEAPPRDGKGEAIPWKAPTWISGQDPTTDWPAFQKALFQAGQHFRALRPKGSAQAARTTLAELEPVLSCLEWEDLPPNLAPELNDLAYYLLLAGGPANTWDAALMLRRVVRADPHREVALLNLADTLDALSKEQNPWSTLTSANCRVQAQEYYRLYALERMPYGFPPALKAKLLEKLGVPHLDPVQCRPRQSLFRALEDKDERAFEAALKAHPEDLDSLMPDQLTALQRCIDLKRDDWALQLLAAGADPNRNSGWPNSKPALLRAISQGNPDLVGQLLAHGASLRAYRNCPPALVAAAYHISQPDSLEVFKRVLAASGPEVDVVDREGCTPLLKAAGWPAPLPWVQLLLDKGADVHRTDKYGRTVLHRLPPFHLEQVAPLMERFLAHGADPNAVDRQGDTPLLHLWVWTGASPETEAGMARILLKHGAKVDTVDREGRTPLFLAVARRNLGGVELLLAAGADPSQATRNRETALQLAERSLQNERAYGRDRARLASVETILARLRQAGAKRP